MIDASVPERKMRGAPADAIFRNTGNAAAHVALRALEIPRTIEADRMQHSKYIMALLSPFTFILEHLCMAFAPRYASVPLRVSRYIISNMSPTFGPIDRFTMDKYEFHESLPNSHSPDAAAASRSSIALANSLVAKAHSLT